MNPILVKAVRSVSEARELFNANINLAHRMKWIWTYKRARGNSDLREELLSLCFMGMWKACLLHDQTISALSTYCYRLMNNEIIAWLRNYHDKKGGLFYSGDNEYNVTNISDEIEVVLSDNLESVRAVDAKMELEDTIEVAHRILGKVHREVFDMKLEGLTLEEMANKLNRTRKAATLRTHRYREMIREHLTMMEKRTVKK